MTPRLRHRISKKTAEWAKSGRAPLAAEPELIRVMFKIREGMSFDPAAISDRGGRTLRNRANLATAELPFDQIQSVIESQPAIALARLPHRFRPLGVTSEGVAVTHTAHFHSSGRRGAGVKIAVIDLGFMGLTEAKASGDLPADLHTRDFTGTGLERHLKHGTGCAEIVHDMAPEAELHLLRIADEQDIYEAFDYCKDNGIDIVSLSIGTAGSGPGNGTGPFEAVCDEARAAGILVVAAAGNGGNFTSSGMSLGTHWEGVFTDGNGDRVHEFSPGYPFNLMIALRDWDDEGVEEDDEVAIVMRWDDWPASTTDYDMHLYQYTGDPETPYIWVASGNGYQTGTQEPVEEIVLDLPNTVASRIYMVKVTREEGSPAGRKLEIFLGGESYFYGGSSGFPLLATSAGSIMEPADAASVLAVGAMNYAQWDSGPQEDYSSQGPTNDWAESAARIKPDITGPDGVASFAYGTYSPPYPATPSLFYGTSAATPHVAGAAALIKSMRPTLSPAELQSALESWAKDMGASGKDNLYGAGKLYLNSPPVLNPVESPTIDEGTRLTFSISGLDEDNDPLTYDAIGLPAGALFDPASATFSWRPSYCQAGAYPVTFRVSDGAALQFYGTSNISITVTAAPPRGDLDASCRVDLPDAIVALRILAGLDVSAALRTDYSASTADVNGNDTVGFAELLFILQLLADLR
jgi:subtilisin family serine protease